MAQPKRWDGIDMFERMKADPYRIPICPTWRENPVFGFGVRVEPYGISNFDAWCYLVSSNFVDWTWTDRAKGKILLDRRPHTIPEALCPIWNWRPEGLNSFLLALREEGWLTDGLTEQTIRQIDWKFLPRWPADAVIPREREQLSKSLRLAVLEKTSGRCVYCGSHLVLSPGKPNSFHADHVLPVEKGGSDDIANLVPACATCNVKKSKKTALQFLDGRTL